MQFFHPLVSESSFLTQLGDVEQRLKPSLKCPAVFPAPAFRNCQPFRRAPVKAAVKLVYRGPLLDLVTLILQQQRQGFREVRRPGLSLCCVFKSAPSPVWRAGRAFLAPRVGQCFHNNTSQAVKRVSV